MSRLPLRETTLIAVCWAMAWVPLAIVAAPAVLVLLALLPGQFLMRLAGLQRQGDGLGGVLVSLAGSITLLPVLLNPLWHLTRSGPILLTAVAGILLVGHVLAGPLGPTHPRREPVAPLFAPCTSLVVFGLIAAVLAIGCIVTYWPVGTSAGPLPVQIHDFVKHHAILYSLERGGLPLGNPFFAPHAAGPVYYYHFFYLIPATLRAMVPGVSIHLAFGLQAWLVALATTGLLALLARQLTGREGPAVLAALLATVIGGLDIIPLVLLRSPAITLDAWADTLVRIHNLLTQMVWTPQNVQGLLVVLLGAFVLSCRRTAWTGWVWLAPLLVAALAGASLWIAAAALPAAGVFALHDALRSGGGARTRRWLALAAIGVLALLITLPTWTGYWETSQRLGKGLALSWPHQQYALLGRHVPPGPLANLLDLPWVLLIELGPLFVLPLMLPRARWRRAWSDPGLRLLLVCASVALLAFICVRSHFRYNDFGQKVIMLVQAAGVVMAAGILGTAPDGARGLARLGRPLALRRDGRRRRVLPVVFGLLLLAGLPVGLFQTPLAAVRRFLPGHGRLGRLVPPAAVRARAEAPLLVYLRDSLPPDAVIQADWGTDRLDLLQMVGHQIGVMIIEQDTMVFQTDRGQLRRGCIDRLARALTQPAPPEAVYGALRACRVTHVIVGQVEQQRWANRAALNDPTLFTPVFEHGDQRVYALR